MKKIIFSILIFLLTSQGWCQSGAVLSGAVVVGAGGSAAAGSCGIIGDNVDSGSANTSDSGQVHVLTRFAAGCSGTLTTAYLIHGDTTDASAKLCVYTSDGTDIWTTDTARVLVGCSTQIVGGTSTGWKSGAMGGGSVTNGSYYWLVLAVEGSAGWSRKNKGNAGMTLWYKNDSNWYTTPPDPGTNTGFGAASNWGTIPMYITIIP